MDQNSRIRQKRKMCGGPKVKGLLKCVKANMIQVMKNKVWPGKHPCDNVCLFQLLFQCNHPSIEIINKKKQKTFKQIKEPAWTWPHWPWVTKRQIKISFKNVNYIFRLNLWSKIFSKSETERTFEDCRTKKKDFEK